MLPRINHCIVWCYPVSTIVSFDVTMVDITRYIPRVSTALFVHRVFALSFYLKILLIFLGEAQSSLSQPLWGERLLNFRCTPRLLTLACDDPRQPLGGARGWGADSDLSAEIISFFFFPVTRTHAMISVRHLQFCLSSPMSPPNAHFLYEKKCTPKVNLMSDRSNGLDRSVTENAMVVKNKRCNGW